MGHAIFNTRILSDCYDFYYVECTYNYLKMSTSIWVILPPYKRARSHLVWQLLVTPTKGLYVVLKAIIVNRFLFHLVITQLDSFDE